MYLDSAGSVIEIHCCGALSSPATRAAQLVAELGGAHGWADRCGPLAALGVVILTQPWAGVVDPVGVLYALAAAACWASCILLTQRSATRSRASTGSPSPCPSLRRLTTAAFATLMALEPACGMVVGLVVLHQGPGLAAVIGICLVVVAGIVAARADGRPAPVPAEIGS